MIPLIPDPKYMAHLAIEHSITVFAVEAIFERNHTVMTPGTPQCVVKATVWYGNILRNDPTSSAQGYKP